LLPFAISIEKREGESMFIGKFDILMSVPTVQDALAYPHL
jgi:hypothetical protein